MKSNLALLFVAVGAGACSSTGTSDPTPSADSGSASDTGDALVDTGPDVPDAGQGSDSPIVEQPPTTDIKLDASHFFHGTYYIAGTISLPAGASSGHVVQLNIVAAGKGNYVGPGGVTGSGTTITYAIVGLPAGTYKVQARVDQTGNQMVGDNGDYEGYARGTVAAPKKLASTADDIAVASSTTGVDFGLAVLP